MCLYVRVGRSTTTSLIKLIIKDQGGAETGGWCIETPPPLFLSLLGGLKLY